MDSHPPSAPIVCHFWHKRNSSEHWMLVGTPMVWDVSVYIWFCDGCDCSVLLEEFLVIIPGKMVVFSVAVGWLCVHMRRWACCLVLFLLCLICSFENGIAIFEALHQHFPPHGAPGSTHAGDVSVFLFVRNLVIAMIHVQDTPDPEFSFSLQDVPNPWQWLYMHHCGIVDFAEVYNKPKPFLGDWKVGTNCSRVFVLVQSFLQPVFGH